DRARKAAALAPLEVLPRRLKARMILGMQGRRLAEGDAASILDLGDREARVRAADIDRDDGLAHISPSQGLVLPPARDCLPGRGDATAHSYAPLPNEGKASPSNRRASVP